MNKKSLRTKVLKFIKRNIIWITVLLVGGFITTFEKDEITKKYLQAVFTGTIYRLYVQAPNIAPINKGCKDTTAFYGAHRSSRSPILS
jgi:hypothetical protein